ncbi:MAG: cytochrome P450 [Alphaproteobacteria bacterium]|nr:cytochrome P450 [Alphaproteobacteria bacterium]MCW5743437.1 cytochrome P450 [Alphaproteobacteria bacterium]
MMMAEKTFDPGTVSRLPDPLPALRDLQERDRVHWSPRYKAWLVTRYDDVRAGLHDPRMTPGRAMPDPGVFEPGFREVFADYRRLLDPFMLFRDPPDHTRLRGLVNRGFTPSAIEGLRPRVDAFVEELLAAMPAHGTFDFVPAFAYPLPARVIAELIGVPETILDDLKRWSDGFATSTAGTGEDLFRRAAVATSEMGAYLQDFLARRRENPGNAIIDALIDARDGKDRLSNDELVANLILFLFAGHETTTNLLSNGLRTLLRNPDMLADLRANLDDRDLVRNTVEEMLRHDGALFMSMRVALQSFEWHGRSIEAGQRVFLYHLSANRDPRVFDGPDRFDIRRKDASRHIAFGYGIHFCLGAPLARLEVEVALPALLRRYRDLALADDQVRWKTNFVLRGPTSLMLGA